jgi:RNA polymerase sigma factor (sigma-70 family)
MDETTGQGNNGQPNEDELLRIVAKRRMHPHPSWKTAWEALKELKKRPESSWRVRLILGPLPDTERELAFDAVWDKVWDNLPDAYRQGMFRGWLLTIARNCLRDFQKKSRNKKRRPLGAPERPDKNGKTPLDLAIEKEERERLDHAISQLDPQLSEVFSLRRKGMSVKEIGTQLGIAAWKVRKLLSKATEKLAEMLKGMKI